MTPGIVGLILGVVGFLLSLGTTLASLAFMSGRFAEFKATTERRLHALEQSDGHAITREEMDARLAELRSSIDAVRDRIADFIDLIKDATKR